MRETGCCYEDVTEKRGITGNIWAERFARCDEKDETRRKRAEGENALFWFATTPLRLIALRKLLNEVITRPLIYLEMKTPMYRQNLFQGPFRDPQVGKINLEPTTTSHPIRCGVASMCTVHPNFDYLELPNILHQEHDKKL